MIGVFGQNTVGGGPIGRPQRDLCSHARGGLSFWFARGDIRPWRADVAQLVAHHLAKVRVAGSNPVIRSKGAVASTPAVEWPSGEATACKAVHTGSIPVSTSVGIDLTPVGNSRQISLYTLIAAYIWC